MDGTIPLVKELDKDFVIPKKKLPEKMENAPDPGNQDYTQQSVVNDSYPSEYYNRYYNQQEMYNYQQYQQFWSSQQQNQPHQVGGYNDNFNNDYLLQQQNRGVKRSAPFKETPKNLVSKYKESFGDLHDPSLPEELRKMLQPLYCQLCTASLNSNLNARMHYSSKNHNKKIRKWLTEHSLQTGEPLHKKALVTEPKPTANDHDPSYYYCELCDLPLTGRVHADQHYCGKNHQKALLGRKAPSGKGFYNEEGKWIRTVAARDDVTGRDGFGQGFILAPAEASASVQPNFNATGSLASQLRCTLCQVAVTSMPQMEVHLAGAKHKKKLKKLENPLELPEIQDPTKNKADPVINSRDPRLNHHPVPDHAQPSKEDLSGGEGGGGYGNIIAMSENGNLATDFLARFRTPSGQYYCKTCDLSVNSDSQFSLHIQSKKHLKKMNLLKA